MELAYNKAVSTAEPDEVDTVSSPTIVYLRKNVHAEERQDIETGETRTVYVYDEAKVSRQDYDNYMHGKTQADIEYLYMMGGLEYE